MAPVMSKPMIQYGLYLLGIVWLLKQAKASTRQAQLSDNGGKAAKKKKEGGGSADFKRDFRRLAKISFGSWTSKEAGILYAFVGILIFRTILSLLLGVVDGYVVKQLVMRDQHKIMIGVVMWLSISLPSSLTNALIKFLQNRLALSIRARLTDYLRDLYFTNENYFRISHLDKRVQNPEHALTEDVSQWADRFAELLSSLGKPAVDLIFFSTVLFKNLGFLNQFTASVLVWETGKALKFVRPNYGEMVQRRGTLEANLRLQHNRVINASEEIAFCSGDKREKSILKQRFDELRSFTARFLKKQIPYHTAEDFVTKYVWTAIGIVQIAVPLIQFGTNAGDNAKYLITMKRMMLRNGDATERLMLGIKEVAEFSGYTQRLMGMIKVFEEQSKAKNQVLGEVTVGENVVVKDLPIVTPTKDVLVEKISFSLQPGDRLLILGPNGCGKSSLFRILCGLWPMMGGAISKPLSRNDLYFIPQKPYLVQGTFRDQVIYPFTHDEMIQAGRTDDELKEILRKVILRPVLEAHGGLDAVKEWAEVLSGGEKQRLGLARVLYHKPRYAILDEVSSAINVEAEQEIFSHLTAYGKEMSLITISHRHSLFKFHNKLLTFDGEGHYEFNDQLHQTQLDGLTKEKYELMTKLNVVLRTLGEDWPSSGSLEKEE